MSQEDRLLTDGEQFQAVTDWRIKHNDELIDFDGHNEVIRKAQDTKSIKLRDQEWVDEIERLSYHKNIEIRHKDKTVSRCLCFTNANWQALKARMEYARNKNS